MSLSLPRAEHSHRLTLNHTNNKKRLFLCLFFLLVCASACCCVTCAWFDDQWPFSCCRERNTHLECQTTQLKQPRNQPVGVGFRRLISTFSSIYPIYYLPLIPSSPILYKTSSFSYSEIYNLNNPPSTSPSIMSPVRLRCAAFIIRYEGYKKTLTGMGSGWEQHTYQLHFHHRL